MTPQQKQNAINLPQANRPGATPADGPFLSVTRGPNFTSRYDEATTDIIFWRGDTRPPAQVFQTGFSSRYMRDHGEREIVWRCAVDDIVPQSAVCLARDIRGAAFFPYPDLNSQVIEDVNYLYAMVVPRAAATYRIQQVVEQAETANANWRRPQRFTYDPDWSNYDAASCVWQFGEYAVHEVPARLIIAGWRCRRFMLVREQNDERVQAGIRFALDQEQLNPIWVPNGASSNPIVSHTRARDIAAEYRTEYPRVFTEYLSYFGLIRSMQMPFSSTTGARQARGGAIQQLAPVLTANDTDWNDRQGY
ncbi:MAG: hypothetical protein AAGC55_06115 [Myxococcota bacterium]